MKQNDKKKEFKAVDYMRQIRAELTELYNQDRKQYLTDLKRAIEEFRIRQKNACR